MRVSAPTDQIKRKRSKSARASGIFLLSSLTVWLLCCLVGLDWFIQTVKPLQYIKTKRYVPLEQNPLVSKLPAFFDSKEKPQLLVLGSSLPMEAIARYDSEFTGSFDEKNLHAVRVYTGARYLQHLIERDKGKQLSAFNLTCVACMASDADLILRRVIDAGRAPQVIIFGIGPRDFMDNMVQPVGKTPVGQLLSSRISLSEIFSEPRSFEDTRDLLLGKLVYLYKVRGDYKTMLTGWACDVSSHPADLHESRMMAALKTSTIPGVQSAAKTDKTAKSTDAKPSQFADLPEWKNRFQPANVKRFEREKASFENMLAICRKNKIRMIVVNMPLTSQNKEIIPAKLYKRYQDEICTMPAKYGDELIDLDAGHQFQLSDFYDSAHLNAQGGKKVQDLIVSSAKSLNM